MCNILRPDVTIDELLEDYMPGLCYLGVAGVCKQAIAIRYFWETDISFREFDFGTSIVGERLP